MKQKITFTILVLCLLMACQQPKGTKLVQAISDKSMGEISNYMLNSNLQIRKKLLIVVPTYISKKSNDEPKDSIHLCITLEDLYNSCPTKLCSFEDFSVLIYNHLQRNNYMRISEKFLTKLKRYIIKENTGLHLSQLSKDALKQKYINTKGKLLHSNLNREQTNELLFLFFKQGIYFVLGDKDIMIQAKIIE